MKLEKKIEKLESVIAKMDDESTDLNKTVDEYAVAIKSAADIVNDLKKTDKKIAVLKKESNAVKEVLINYSNSTE